MSELRFDFEWADPMGARGLELRATWARLVIWVDGRCPTRVFDHELNAVRDGIYLPLYPLAEWLAMRWWSVLVEVPSPERLGDPAFRERHSLRAARDGFALPPAVLTTVGDHIRLRWYREALPNYRVEFIEEGSAQIPIDQFRHAATMFIAATIARLESEGVTNTPLQSEWAALSALSEEEREFCAVAAALGLDPFGLEPETETEIVRVAESVPPPLRHEFLSVASANELSAEAGDVLRAYEAAHANASSSLASLADLRRELRNDDLAAGFAPWTRGYLDAHRLREVIGIGSALLPSFEDLAGAFHLTEQDLASSLVRSPGATGVYDALVATNRRASPAFVVSPRHSEASQRFHFTRGLYAYIRAKDSGPWLVTKSLSDQQKQTRAFAAEFLAPAAALRERVSSAILSADDVDDIAAEFGVSPYVVQHQLENHHIATIVPS